MVDSTTIDNLFSAVTQAQTQQTAIAKYVLANAQQLAQNKKYPEAVVQLKKAIALDPTSQDAYNTLGTVYLAQNNTTEAIKVYKRLTSVAPTSADAYNSLGNAYVQAGNNAEAEKAYKTAARMDPSSTYAPYTLGNLYLQQGRLAEAETQFQKVMSIAPRDAHGYYGLSQVYNREGRFDEAVQQAQKSMALDKKFGEPVFELAQAYLGLGDKDAAGAQLAVLSPLDATLASDLSRMLSAPKLVGTIPGSTSLNTSKKPGTLLSSLDPSLLFPNTSKDFSVTFQFNSNMDVESVMNVTNWSIRKASGGEAGTYNNGVTIDPATQVTVPNMPRRVLYDPDKMQATVYFTLSQNSAVTAEIDPSHLVFKFSGIDEDGNAMDTSSDEYDGFATIPF